MIDDMVDREKINLIEDIATPLHIFYDFSFFHWNAGDFEGFKQT